MTMTFRPWYHAGPISWPESGALIPNGYPSVKVNRLIQNPKADAVGSPSPSYVERHFVAELALLVGDRPESAPPPEGSDSCRHWMSRRDPALLVDG